MGALSRALCLTGLWLVSASSSVYLFADTHEIQMLDASIEELQDQLQAGTLSSVTLVRWYQDRIDRYDQQGPTINAIQHSNSDAISLAKALDEERQKSGPRTLLHGIPVLVKDNYETRGMPTTAGSILFTGHAPDRDATQVDRLKKAGAIILAKTTMHEFAYGWTTEGSAFGATKNPYGLMRHPGGSSGGQARASLPILRSWVWGAILAARSGYRQLITISSVSGGRKGSVVDSESCRYQALRTLAAH